MFGNCWTLAHKSDISKFAVIFASIYLFMQRVWIFFPTMYSYIYICIHEHILSELKKINCSVKTDWRIYK